MNMAWDKNKTKSWFRSHSKYGQSGWCAKYVRQAMEYGGLKISPENGPNAACYANSLDKQGFRVVFEDFVKGQPNTQSDLKGYVPQDGDINILAASAKHRCGHIEVFFSNYDSGGDRWLSDFPGVNINCYSEGRIMRIFRYTGGTENS